MNDERRYRALRWGALVIAISVLSCGGGKDSKVVTQKVADPDACACTPEGKRVDIPLPQTSPTETSIQAILDWGPNNPAIEGKLFHVGRGYLQRIRIFSSDCDVVMEISETADRSAPRIMVETPIHESYCTARRTLQTQLNALGEHMKAGDSNGELNQPRPVEVLGLAYFDCDACHDSFPKVKSLWELHPGTVSLLPQ
jgi:hypothetical protein